MVYLITYGCKVNYYETESVASLLTTAGIKNQIINDGAISRLEDADIFVLNSCAVTSMAEKKSRYGLSKIKKYHPGAKIVTMGCAMGRKSPEQVANEVSGRVLQKSAVIHMREKAFIKVQDGCKNFCSYCIIPYIRNELKYIQIADVVNEINLQPSKVEEIILCGINLCYYPEFDNLCLAVDRCGRKWSISSLEPPMMTERLIETLHKCNNFIPNFYICLQSGSDNVLKDMNRHYTTEQYLQIIKSLRRKFDNAKFSTDIIVGYPTETEEDFQLTMNFVRLINFDNIQIFPFSPREGTKAEILKPITNSIVTQRFETLSNLVSAKSKFIKSKANINLKK